VVLEEVGRVVRMVISRHHLLDDTVLITPRIPFRATLTTSIQPKTTLKGERDTWIAIEGRRGRPADITALSRRSRSITMHTNLSNIAIIALNVVMCNVSLSMYLFSARGPVNSNEERERC